MIPVETRTVQKDLEIQELKELARAQQQKNRYAAWRICRKSKFSPTK